MLVTKILLVDGPGAGGGVVAEIVLETELELARLLLASTKDTQLGGQALDGSRVDGTVFGALASDSNMGREGWQVSGLGVGK